MAALRLWLKGQIGDVAAGAAADTVIFPAGSAGLTVSMLTSPPSLNWHLASPSLMVYCISCCTVVADLQERLQGDRQRATGGFAHYRASPETVSLAWIPLRPGGFVYRRDPQASFAVKRFVLLMIGM